MLAHPAVLTGHVLPRRAVITVLAVVGFAALTAVAAQFAIPLPFTPVPITGQTLAVLLTGAALGSRAGAASQLLYVGVGALGAPVYAEGAGGWDAATGPTAGYFAGFVVAAYVVGLLAERKQDRSFATSLPAFLTGSVIIYGFGLAWLLQSLDVDLATALGLGLAPFVVGDIVKALIAAGITPTAWRLVGRSS